MNLSEIYPELRDGVEVFVLSRAEDACTLLFVFLSNRRRLKIKCLPAYAELVKRFSKGDSLLDALTFAGLVLDARTENFLKFLEAEGIVMQNPLETSLLPKKYIERYKRQIYFLLDTLKQADKAINAQKKIFDAHITIVGLGAIGSTILVELCMMGFRKFTLIDYSNVEENDVARTLYPVAHDLSCSKVDSAKKLVEEYAFFPKIGIHNSMLSTQSNLDELVLNTDLIINTADEPYIGYTNIKLSRYAINKNIPIVAAGGFDAHLASLGEILVPFKTPCADCYSTFFHENLKNWKPIPHPVKNRSGCFGGLGSLASFSASACALEVFNYFTAEDANYINNSRRGEFLFHDYSLDSFYVNKDEDCITCRGRND